jgi:hypothetical protein
MTYRLDINSPETFQRFSESDRRLVGVKPRYRKLAQTVEIGDLLLAYVTGVSRWFGLLEVTSAVFDDATPRFVAFNDPYTLRFTVKAEVCLPLELAIPIHDDQIWTSLSFTRQHDRDSSQWTGSLRTSLVELSPKDGSYLAEALRRQARERRTYPLDDADEKLLKGYRVKRPEGAVSVSVPEDLAVDESPEAKKTERESIKIQALLARIGAGMKFKVWIPANDRALVVNELRGDDSALLRELPMNYDEVTIKTIERIDVIWVQNRTIVRAFEVEHTTAIYSGILRMADLLSLQPNMDIRLHIVAPEERREKVFAEITRPVFSLLGRRPLKESCTFLSYDSVRELADLPHLAHLSDSIVTEYEEAADE